MTYPDSLVHPDKHAFQPRIGLAWRPFPASSMVVRAGYGVYYNTSVYQTIAHADGAAVAAFEELERANSAAGSADAGERIQRLAEHTPNTFAIDPEFPRRLCAELADLGAAGFARRAGHDGDVSRHQRDARRAGVSAEHVSGGRGESVPSLSVGIRLHDLERQFHARGRADPIAAAGCTTALRRAVQYTYSKSIDDAALGRPTARADAVIAQDWLDLSGERGLSNFDQRHLLRLQGSTPRAWESAEARC